MKIWFSRILMGLVILLIVALVGGAIFLLTFDPNAYKSRLEQIVYDRYHRTLSIDGDIELSLFPRIGLAVRDVSLSDRDSADTFASIDSARFAVAIWPLLSNRFVVDHVSVTGFRAWLVRDDDGRFNFRDLVQNRHSPSYPPSVVQADAPTAATVLSRSSRDAAYIMAADYRHRDAPALRKDILLAATETERADFQIDIAGLDLKDGEVHFLDRKTGATGRIEGVDMTTGRMTFGQAFDFSVKGKLVGDRPGMDAQFDGQAVVQLDPPERVYSAQRVNLQLKGRLGDLDASTATLRGNLAYNEYSQMFSASNLELQVQGETRTDPPIHGLAANLTVPQLLMDRSQAELQVTRLALRARGEQSDSNFDIALDAPSLSISPEAAKSEPLVATFRRNGSGSDLGISLNMNGLGGDAFDLTLNELKLDSTQKQGDRLVSIQMSSPATWSPFGRQGGLSAMKGDVRIEDTTLPGGVFQFPFIGSLHADLYKDELTSALNAVFGGNKIDFNVAVHELNEPKVTFDLTADSVDLNTLFPPPGKPIAETAEPAEPQPAEPSEDQPAEPAPEPEPEPVREFDWSFLDSAHVQGSITANALKAGGLELTGLEASIAARDGVLYLRDVKADLYGGSVTSNASFSSGHDVTFDLTAVDVGIQPVIQAFFQKEALLGRADLNVALSTHGSTTPALISGLDGSVKAHVQDGAWVGLNLGQTIVEINEVLRNAFSGQLPGVASRFDVSRRTEFDTLDLDVELQNGQGRVRELTLVSPYLHVNRSEPAAVDLVKRQLDLMLLVRGKRSGTSTGPDFAALEGVTVPVRVSGSFDDPSYEVQWQDIGHSAVKDAIQGGLLDILSQLPGEGGGSFLFPLPDKSDDPAKRDPLKSIGDALKGLLGQ